MTILDPEEYIEQAFFFRVVRERLLEDLPLQEILQAIQEEILATSKLPMAIEFLRTELMHQGSLAPAMRRLSHYFAPFQTYVVSEGEEDRSRFDMRVGLQILELEAQYRAAHPQPQGLFLYQFETLCRNRLRYDEGLKAMSEDPFYNAIWSQWILTVRRQIGLVEFADMIYVRSEFYAQQQLKEGNPRELSADETLFGEKEGRIAWANRRKEPLYMLAALQRQLGYPAVPRIKPSQVTEDLLPQLARRLERLEYRLKLLDDEQKSGIDLTKFYVKEDPPSK
jgi:hypothetical protein